MEQEGGTYLEVRRRAEQEIRKLYEDESLKTGQLQVE